MRRRPSCTLMLEVGGWRLEVGGWNAHQQPVRGVHSALTTPYLSSKGLDPTPVCDVSNSHHQAEVTDRVPEHTRQESVGELTQKVCSKEAA